MLLACQKEQKKYEKALATCEAIIGLDSTNAQAHCGRGYVLNKIGKYQEAIESFDRALAIQPEFTDAFLNRGNSLRNLKRYDEAFAAYEKALALQPDLEGAWVGRGNVFLNRNRDTEALECYDTALALKPDSADAKFNKALLKLSLGEYEEGWKLYEWRWKIGNFTSPIRHFPQPLWIGNSDIGGKTILVHAEQGFGDTIQFSRYVNLLKDKQCKIIFEIPKQLSSLFKSPNWQCDVVVQGELIPWFDLHCPLMSLPLAFRTEVETIPATIPYIKAHKDKKIE